MPRAAVITISDTRSSGQHPDRSGPAAVARLRAGGFEIARTGIVPDDRAAIERALRELVGGVELIVTTGGTGISQRDVTPEAVSAVIERALPGFGEIMRTGSYARTPLSIIARSGAGVAGRTLIVFLPGSPKAVEECLDLVLPAARHVVEVLERQSVDCAAAVAAGSGPTVS